MVCFYYFQADVHKDHVYHHLYPFVPGILRIYEVRVTVRRIRIKASYLDRRGKFS